MAVEINDKSADNKGIELSKKQLMGLAVSFVLALLLLVSGFYVLFSCFAMVIIALILYMIPHLLKVKNIKVFIMHGAAFMLVALLVGALYSSPAYVDEHNDFEESGGFTGASGSISADTYTFDVTYNDTDPTHKPLVTVLQIDKVGFSTIYSVQGSERIVEPNSSYVPGTGTATFDIQLDDKLYVIYFYMADTANSDAKINDSQSVTFFLDGMTSDSAKTSVYWIGTAYYLGLCILLYFMIVFLTYGMRSSAEKTRDKMVQQGRLYPPGYGRCKQCDSIVLPGEVNCRKCGAYIDVPEGMKPDKKDCFICSDCGAEVPENADKCPKCGAGFDDGVEIEVHHADGTVEISESTFECPECGKDIPSSSEFCPKCGNRFDKKK